MSVGHWGDCPTERGVKREGKGAVSGEVDKVQYKSSKRSCELEISTFGRINCHGK